MSNSQRPAYAYRAMTSADVAAAHALSVQLKWPHRLEDWAMLQRVSQGFVACLLYTSPSPRDQRGSRMPSSA